MARITKSNPTKKTTSSDLPDSNSLLRRRAQRSPAKAPAPKRQLRRQPSYCSQGTQTDDLGLENGQNSRVFVSNRERVDSILAQLYTFWWSLTTFLQYYVTAPSSSGHEPPERRVNRLWRAIFENSVTEDRLLRYGSRELGRLHWEPLCKQIQTELENLTRQK